ncbi:MAG: Amuc_1098 family type IV pilus outer membrane protein [Luteolibacter sp.]
METFKPIKPSRGRAALLATACLISPLLGGDIQGDPGLAEVEHSRRSANLMEAQELLQRGDEAYKSAHYAEAVEAYAGARDLIPNAPISADLRDAATQRYAQASVEQARVLSRKGDVAGAKAVVDKILSPGVDPENPDALAFRNQLDDPIRTNPALTAEHAKNVDTVRRLLYTAEGAYNLGKFDEAKATYGKVLQIDPTNTAARRGMERVANSKTEYYKTAQDESRAAILSQVDAAWETQVPAADLPPTLIDPGAILLNGETVQVKAKIDRIIVPKIAMDQVSLEEALDFLRVRTQENDTLESDPAKKGVNFTVNLGSPDSEAAKKIRSLRFDLRLTQVPVSQVLKYITDMTQTAYRTDDFSVIISPVGAVTDELVSRTYRVPPDFISNLSNGEAAGGAAAEDPFADKSAKGGGLLAKRMGAKEALMKQGVPFPDGANANYNPSTNVLRIINTPINQDYIAQLIETLTQTEPVMVSVKVTMISVQQTRLEELGFDWLLNPVALSDTVFGSGGTVGNTPGRVGADFINPVNGTSVDGIPADPNGQVNNLMTNGNRSGSTAINQNGIDNLINNPNRSAQRASVAPGILSLTGLFTDGQVQSVMRGLDQKKGVDVMARPAVTTRSGQASSLTAIREFIYPTEYEPPELPNSVGSTGGNTTPVTPATPTAFDKKDVGIHLEVLPVADANKQYIDLTVNPTFSTFDGFVNYGSPINSTTTDVLGNPQTVVVTQNAILMPVFSKQSVSTNVHVADGSTIVIGGLMKESIQDVEDKVPVFGSIPVIGRLFQTKARQPVSTAILFFVNVELLDPTGRPYRNK